MEEYYRGDTFKFPFEFIDDSGESIDFEVDDIVRFGMKKYIDDTDNYCLYKEKEIETSSSEITFVFNPEETKKLDISEYIIELELTRNGETNTIYQNIIKVAGDVLI